MTDSSSHTSMCCALCGNSVRSVYARPGEREARFCGSCFFGSPPTTEAKPDVGAKSAIRKGGPDA